MPFISAQTMYTFYLAKSNLFKDISVFIVKNNTFVCALACQLLCYEDIVLAYLSI